MLFSITAKLSFLKYELQRACMCKLPPVVHSSSVVTHNPLPFECIRNRNGMCFEVGVAYITFRRNIKVTGRNLQGIMSEHRQWDSK